MYYGEKGHALKSEGGRGSPDPPPPTVSGCRFRGGLAECSSSHVIAKSCSLTGRSNFPQFYKLRKATLGVNGWILAYAYKHADRLKLAGKCFPHW